MLCISTNGFIGDAGFTYYKRKEGMVNIADIEAFDDLSRKVDKQEGLIETLKKMHDEDVKRIEALEKKFEKVEEVYPFTVDDIDYEYGGNLFAEGLEDMKKYMERQEAEKRRRIIAKGFDNIR